MAVIDANKQIRWAVDSGKVSFGKKSAEKSLLKGEGQLVIISANAPQQEAERVRALSKIAGIPIYSFKGNGIELGSVCGKPFVVSTMLVMDAGKSKVLELAKK
jgi:large subunit ribosomal protein L30e